MKLFFSPGACSLSPHIVLAEGVFNFTTEKVDLKAGTYAGGDYSKINPKGYVPALQLDNGEVLTEGAAIVQYLGDKKPEAKLIPAVGTMERARCIEWLVFTASELHKGFGPLWNPTATESEKSAAKDRLGKRFAYVNEKLKGKDYLLGSQFSVADPYLFTIASWCDHAGVDVKDFSNLKAFSDRMKKRPKVQEVLKAEGLI